MLLCYRKKAELARAIDSSPLSNGFHAKAPVSSDAGKVALAVIDSLAIVKPTDKIGKLYCAL